MSNDTTQAAADGARIEATQIVKPVAESRPGKRPFGRSLDDFRDQRTESCLLPAEEKLLAAVTKGDLCDLSSFSTSSKLREELGKATSDPEVIKLAAEVVASPRQIFQWHSNDTKDEREARKKLEARIGEQLRITREFLTELPRFADSHSKAPKDLKARVVAEPELLRPILEDLKKQFESELWHWRQVDPADPAVRVRAAFVRFLALGGDEAAPVHEKGGRLEGAFIDGEFDLTDCADVRPLEFKDCLFSDSVNFPRARLRRLSLSGCRVPKIDGVRCRTEGSVFLDEGFSSSGSVRLVGAAIGGNLACSDGRFSAGFNCANGRVVGDVDLSSRFNAKGEVSLDSAEIGGDLNCQGTFSNRTEDGKGRALSCGNAKIAGDVLFDSVTADGRIVFMSVEIGGTLGCDGGTFRNQMPKERRPTLQCQGAKIKGNALLRNGFSVEGGVGFAGAQIGGTLDCSSATFSNLVALEAMTAARSRNGLSMAGEALDLTQATIDGALWFRQLDYVESSIPTKIKGSINLVGAHARLLVDHPDCWPERISQSPDGERLSCGIELDGFTYDRFAGGAPTDAEHRLAWLSHQPPEHLRGDFRPQPFEQLIKVLRDMGHEGDAQQIAVAKLRMRRRAKWAAIWRDFIERPRRWWGWAFKPFEIIKTLLAAIGLFFHWLVLDLLLGSGYAKVRPILLFLVMLFGCAWYYDRAAEQSAFAPTNPVIYNDPEVRKACAGTTETPDIAAPIDWYRCKKAPFELNPFRPLVYSVDQMIPFLQLGQKREWQPISRQLRFDLWGIAQVTLPALTTLIVTWSQSIGSTLLYLLIAAILGGLIKRD